MADSPPKETPTQQMTTPRFPGFKFSPADEELITYYLRKKLEGCESGVEVIAEVEICRYEPWDLPAKSVVHSENEWFFFSARGKKYPYGTQSRRATELGYWKSTGKERNVKVGDRVIGTKRTLVFHMGRAPKGERTEWIMHEFCLVGKSQDSPVVCRVRRNTEFRSGDGMSRASMSQGPSLIAGEENRRASEGNVEIRADVGEAFMTSTSNYGSYSINSTRESNQKSMNDTVMTEPSTHPKDKEDTGYYNDVDDYLAHFLNDDLALLDETATSSAPTARPMELCRADPFQAEPQQEVSPDLMSYPGITSTAQIISPSEPTNPPANSTEHDSADEGKSFDFPRSPMCIFMSMVGGNTRTRMFILGAVVMALIAVVAAACSEARDEPKAFGRDCFK